MRHLVAVLGLLTLMFSGCEDSIGDLSDCSPNGKECQNNKEGKTQCSAGQCVFPKRSGCLDCLDDVYANETKDVVNCEGNLTACNDNNDGKTVCIDNLCVPEIHVSNCTAAGNECAKNSDSKVSCIENTCSVPVENQTQCSDASNECMANNDGKTSCYELMCEVPFINEKICTNAGKECENNRNSKVACVDTACHIPLIRVESCTADGNECALNTDGNIACTDDRCVKGFNPHVRINWREEPATNAIISVTGNNAQLFIDGEKRRSVIADYARTVTPYSMGLYEDSLDQKYAHFKLENLSPSTPYYFSIKTDEGISREFYFVTAPNDERDFKLLYGGDSRSRPVTRRIVNQLLKTVAEADSDIIAFIHGGDYNAYPNDWAQWSGWLDDHEIFVADDGRILPMIATRGNHEGNAVTYNQVFAFPATDDTDYWTTAIGRLLWITLDTNVSGSGDQKIFVRAALEKGQSYRWIVPSYHAAAYPAVKSRSLAYTHWVPLFEEYNVDFVAESDGHALKRTVPIRDGQLAADGIVYIGEGGLGVPQRTPKIARWFLQPPGMAMSGHHIQRLSFSESKAVYEAITLDGNIVDSYEFMPRDRSQ